MFAKLREKGVDTAFVTLHVGLGTFRPVKEDNILDHKMHVEHYSIPQETADKIKPAESVADVSFQSAPQAVVHLNLPHRLTLTAR